MLMNGFHASVGPGLASLVYAACIWVGAMMVVLYHRAGIQVIGATIAIVGFAIMLLETRFFLALSLFTVGLLIHSCGRILFNMKRRQ